MNEVELRIEKFKRKAPMIQSAEHLEKILTSFPEEMRGSIRAQVLPLLSSEFLRLNGKNDPKSTE